jgi:hypothetical protein
LAHPAALAKSNITIYNTPLARHTAIDNSSVASTISSKVKSTTLARVPDLKKD